MKIVKITPAFTLICLLISTGTCCQEIIANYLSKETCSLKLDDLRQQFGINKKIPGELEMECLTALSYYPELKNISITFKFGKPASTMVSRPKMNSVLRKNEKREYLVIIRRKGSSKNGLVWDELSFPSLVGWIGHELAHIAHYDQKAFGGILLVGIRYAFPKFRHRYERFTDQLAIKHNLGYALYEGTQYTINSSNATDRYKKYLQKFYLSPAEIKKYTDLINSYKLNYRRTRIVDINSIVKAK